MIELKNVSCGYNDTNVIKDLSLTLQHGKITAIIGANGCGKSTLLKLICGQLKPRQGEVLLENNPVSSMKSAQIARKIAYLPQSRKIPDITVESLVLHGRFPWTGYPRVYKNEDRNAAVSAMEKTGILHMKKKLIAALSGGERQKAYIAMTLAQNTEYVLLDEPTTYLDIAYQLEFIELLNILKSEGKTTAVVIHDINAALDTADNIAVMKDGQILKTAVPETILTSGVIEEAFNVKINTCERIGFKSN